MGKMSTTSREKTSGIQMSIYHQIQGKLRCKLLNKTKHVEVDRHFIKEKLEVGIICQPFVRYEDQFADILTKAVASKPFAEILSKLSIEDLTTQFERECRN